MNKFTKLIVVLALTTLCVSAFAAGHHLPGPDTSKFQAANSGQLGPAVASTIVKRTYITSGAPFLAVPAATFTVLDPGTTVNCPGTTACRLLVSAWATSANATGGNRALCLVVDGAIVGFCAYLGSDDTSGLFSHMTSLDEPVAIGPGNHSALIYEFSNGGNTVAFYRTLYEVVKP
jgi:hypothetical protein